MNYFTGIIFTRIQFFREDFINPDFGILENLLREDTEVEIGKDFENMLIIFCQCRRDR